MTSSVGTCHHSPSTGTDTTVLMNNCVARRLSWAKLFFPQHLMWHVGMHLYCQGQKNKQACKHSRLHTVLTSTGETFTPKSRNYLSLYRLTSVTTRPYRAVNTLRLSYTNQSVNQTLYSPTNAHVQFIKTN